MSKEKKDEKDMQKKKECGCEHKNEKHKDDCECKHEGHHHDHGEHDEHCDCGCEDETIVHGFKDNEEFQKYEKAFIQLEDALIKVDKELEETKKKAEENEHLARTYKKDLERYKERAKEEEEQLKIKAIENIALKLIPILDSFEQALKVGGDKNTIKGFEMIEGMLKDSVKALGIEEIDAEGKEFDPNYHNAVAKRKTKDQSKANKIATVYQKGYKMQNSDKIIRHSMVEIYSLD